MIRSRIRPTLLGCAILAILAALAGCAVGPNFERPQTQAPVPEAWAAEGAAPTLADATPTLRWWEGFQDPVLNGLVEDALTHNNDLDAAAARVLEARAALGGSTSALFPSVTLGATANRSQTSEEFSAPGAALTNNLFNVAATASWEADLWGKLRRGREASVASVLASENDLRAFAQSLIANVTLSWLTVKELQLQVDLNEHTVASYEENVQIVGDRYRRGIISSLDLQRAQQSLAAARANGPSLRQQLVEAKRRLEILVGRYPAGAVIAATDGDDLALPDPLDPVPAGLPSDLLERRPDLLAAEARLHAAFAGVGQAKAALYPRLALTAEGGSTTREFSELLTDPTEAWSLIANLAMPLINRGQTKAQIKAAEARLQQSAASYRSSVLGAFAEVENALDQDANLTSQEGFLVESASHARESLRLAESRYSRGLDSVTVLLDTQRQLFSTESQLLSVQRARRAARVNLILALGGAWADDVADLQNTETILRDEDPSQGADQ